MFSKGELITIAIESCFLLTILNNAGNLSLRGLLPSQVSTQNLVCDPSFTLKCPNFMKESLTFIRLSAYVRWGPVASRGPEAGRTRSRVGEPARRPGGKGRDRPIYTYKCMDHACRCRCSAAPVPIRVRTYQFSLSAIVHSKSGIFQRRFSANRPSRRACSACVHITGKGTCRTLPSSRDERLPHHILSVVLALAS
jgi:hypothetical protein